MIRIEDIPKLEPPERTRPVNLSLYPREIARLEQLGGGPSKTRRRSGLVAGIRRLLAMVEDESHE